MRKRLAPAVVVVVVLTVFLAGIAVAQSGVLAGLAQPVVVSIEQLVPVDVTLALPQQDGSVITTTAPLTVGVSLQIKIDGNHVVAVAPAAEAEPAEVAVATPTPEVEDAETIWDLPHVRGSLSEPLDVGGFLVAPDLALFDFDQVKAISIENARFYENDAFQGATMLGVLYLTLTNTTDVDLALTANDGVVVVGTEQADLSDFQYLGDDIFGDALLPGVTRDGPFVFALVDTNLADIAEGTEARLQMKGPIKDSYIWIDDSKYQATITLEPQ